MKKHLIAAAVAAAVAAPAMAQNVTISGVFDTSVIANSKLETQAANGGVVVSTDNSVTALDGAWATSEMILSGTEDLGGGLKAGFRLATGLNGGASLFADRDRFLQLEGSMGRVQLGRINTAAATGFHGLTAATTNQAGTTYMLATASTTANGTGAIFGNLTGGNFERSGSNTIQFTSPTFNGFVINANYSQNSSDRSDADRQGETSAKQMGLHLGYTVGPVTLGVATNKRDVDIEAAPAVAQVLPGNAGTAAVANSTRQADLRWVAGSYNLGVATVSLAYLTRQDSTTNAAGVNAQDSNAKISVVGLTIPAGAATIRASYYTGDNSVTVANNDDIDLQGYQLSVNYALSKRTSVYAVMGDSKTERTGANVGASRSYNSNAIGITHTF
jgi:predicted porin